MTSTASIGGHPIHAILIAFPVALFATVLLFDLIYVFRGRDPFWAVVLPLSILGIILVGAQGWLGGELVYRYHVGVQPTETNRQSPTSAVAPKNGKAGALAGTPTQSSAATSPAIPPNQLALAQKAYSAKCAGCRKINGKGGEMGRDLSHEGTLHDAAWIGTQITNPRAHQKNSGMPPFPNLPQSTRTAISM